MQYKTNLPGETFTVDQPHLLAVNNKGAGLPILPGTALWLIAGKNEQFPFVLKAVKRDRITFMLADTEYTYKLTGGKPLTRDAAQRMAKNRGD